MIRCLVCPFPDILWYISTSSLQLHLLHLWIFSPIYQSRRRFCLKFPFIVLSSVDCLGTSSHNSLYLVALNPCINCDFDSFSFLANSKVIDNCLCLMLIHIVRIMYCFRDLLLRKFSHDSIIMISCGERDR